MDTPDEPKDADQLMERARQAEVRVRRADTVIFLLQIAFFIGFGFVAWSCRDGCSSFSWFYILLYPAAMVFYFVRRRQREGSAHAWVKEVRPLDAPRSDPDKVE